MPCVAYLLRVRALDFAAFRDSGRLRVHLARDRAARVNVARLRATLAGARQGAPGRLVQCAHKWSICSVDTLDVSAVTHLSGPLRNGFAHLARLESRHARCLSRESQSTLKQTQKKEHAAPCAALNLS